MSEVSKAMMKRIAEERTRIDAYKHSVGTEKFFNDRQYKEDIEWLTLAYLADILAATGAVHPQFAEKIQGDGQPDFQTYIQPDIRFRRVEVTEVHRPDYRRGAVFRALAARGTTMYPIGRPHQQPWSSFAKVLRNKIRKPYSPDSWLVIYHNMGYSDFQDGELWHERTQSTLRNWTYESDATCDITRSQFESIFVIDSSGTAAIRLHPHWDVVKALRE